MANSSLNPQGAGPVDEGFIVPVAGISVPVMTGADANGNLRQSALGPNAGLAYFGSVNFRDAFPTVQNGGTAAAPAAGATIATVTPGTAGLWEVAVTLGITGTTAAATDSNNFALYQSATARLTPITFPVQSTSGNNVQGQIPPVVLNLSATDTVSVRNVVAATVSSVYAATIVARRVG